MKKILLFVISLCMILVFLSSCSYKSNQWFSNEKLDKCLVSELPEIADNYLNKNDEDIYVKFSEDEYEDYVNRVYEYLKSKNFEYLGTRGELQSSLSGAFNTYYFQPADALEEFYVDGAYRFVYSDGKVEELDDTFRFRILTINTIGLNTTKTIEDNGLNFKYNTVISLRYNSEYPLNGRYVLKREEHEHTGEWMPYNQNIHYYEYTCGCTLPDRIEEHMYDDSYLFCVICGYDTFDEPPCVEETISLRNLTGCEWLNEITAEDIAEIKIISEAVGVAPGNLKNISSSTDEAVIARILEEYYQLDTRPISKMEGQIDGGGSVTVKFMLKDGTEKKLYINNGNYRDTDDNHFELLSTPKFKNTDNKADSYGFITYIGTGMVYDKENNPVCEIPIDELEFVESDGCVDAVVTGYYYMVETEFGTLWFDYSNDLFYLRFEDGEDNYREYYRLVGKNLDELIVEYSTTTE